MRGSEQMLRRPGESHPTSSLEPAEIAQRVRQIAHDLNQMLKSAAPTPPELTELVGRIDELRAHIKGTPMIGLDRWLDSSRTAIRARVGAEKPPAGDKFTGTRRCPEYTTSC